MLKRRALITNFNGLGNGILLLPILKRLEEVTNDLSYFHVYNPVFQESAFIDRLSINQFLGPVPAIWRRFDHESWNTIDDFIDSNAVNLIVNLRDQDATLDRRYLDYKQSHSTRGLDFWDLYEVLDGRSTTQHITQDIVDLLLLHEIDVRDYNRHWLHDSTLTSCSEQWPSGRIGFFTAASLLAKRWSPDRWIALGEAILESTEYQLNIYSGLSAHERQIARKVVEHLRSKSHYSRCTLVESLPLPELVGHMAGLSLLVSNDSVAVHIAAALNLPTVALYLSTDAAMWGGLSDAFIPIQSQSALSCSAMKKSLGNCTNYYQGCSVQCSTDSRAEVDATRVFNAACSLLEAQDS